MRRHGPADGWAPPPPVDAPPARALAGPRGRLFVRIEQVGDLGCKSGQVWRQLSRVLVAAAEHMRPAGACAQVCHLQRAMQDELLERRRRGVVGCAASHQECRIPQQIAIYSFRPAVHVLSSHRLLFCKHRDAVQSTVQYWASAANGWPGATQRQLFY